MAHNNQESHIDNWKSHEPQTTSNCLPRRSVLAATGAGLLGSVLASGTATAEEEGEEYHLKSRPTIYTNSMRENARSNVEELDWAASRRDSAVDAADGYLSEYAGSSSDPDLESLWSLITSQEIPRGGGYPYERDILGGYENSGTNRLWKIETTVDNPHGDGNLTVPTNDFGAYRESGLDDRGMFDPELADDSLHVNEEHPEMGETWGVDDGYGWIDENNDLGGGEENRWNFVAYYNHWFIWRPGGVRRILEALSDAYLLTDDPKYAIAGLVMLDRIGDVYPEMIIDPYKLPEIWNNTGGVTSYSGRIIGRGWEGNLVQALLPTYDAFFPALDTQQVADGVTSFLDEKTNEYSGLPEKDTVGVIRENIESNFVQETLVAAKNGRIRSNRGQGPAVALSARIQDDTRDGGYTAEALEWLFQPGGGGVLAELVNNCDRDGYWNESSPLYNRIRMSEIQKVAEHLAGYDGYDGADLYQHPKLQKALGINTDLLLLDNLVPEIGDTHAYANGGAELWSSTTGISERYKLTGEEGFAQLWHFVNGYSTAGIRGSIYDPDPEGLSEDIQTVIDAKGPLDLSSQNLAGYGFAALRDGENYLNQSFGTTLDTSELFDSASTAVNDSFDEAIQFEATQEDEWWTFEFDTAETGEYEIEVEALFTDTYGIYELYINDEYIDTVDFLADGSGRDTLSYMVDLSVGSNTMRWEVVGRNENSDNYKMALYSLSLLDEEDREIRDGVAEQGNNKRAFWLYYGRTAPSHGHLDILNIGVAAHEMELARDLGYPDQTMTYPPRQFFTENTISHNTVTVDEKGQVGNWVGTPRHFDGENERVNLIDVDAADSYEVTDEYRRTTAMISVDDEHSYAVDFFNVQGGDSHRFSFHGTKAAVSTEGLDLTSQESGTLAGEDVAYADDDYNDAMYDDSIHRTEGAGLNYFDNVERDDDPSEKVVIDWDVEDHFNVRDDNADEVHMRLTSVGDFDEVELADGYPPSSSNSTDTEPSIRYAFLNRSGSDLTSTFTSTIEHYNEDRAIESVEAAPVDGDGRAVRVELTTGRTDYVVCAFDEEDTLVVDDTFEFKGFFGVYSIKDGEPEYAYVHDGMRLKPLDGPTLVNESTGHVRGFVEGFTGGTSLENEVTIRIAGDRSQLDRYAGFVYVDNDDSNPWRGNPDPEASDAERNAAYPIEGYEMKGNTVTFDVGDRTFTQGFADPTELEDGGYEYTIAEDDDVRIPLVASWSPEPE